MRVTLQELLEQRALLEKQLVWLDAKIAQFRAEPSAVADSEGGDANVEAGTAAGTDTGVEPDLLSLEVPLEQDLEDADQETTAITEDGILTIERKDIATQTRTTCLVMVAVVSLLGALFLGLIFFLYPD